MLKVVVNDAVRSLTAAVERDVGVLVLVVKLDIQRRRVGLESEARRDVLVVAGVVGDVARSIIVGELVSDAQLAWLREVFGAPDGVANGVAVVAALVVVVGLANVAVIVELLGGVVAVNVLALAGELVDRVLDRPDAAVGVLGDADRVAQAPAEDVAVEELVGARVGVELGQVEAADLRVARLNVAGVVVLVGLAAAGDEQGAGLLLGHEQRAGRVVRVAHVGDERLVGVAEGEGLGVVGPREDLVGGGGVEGLAVVGEGEAMVELNVQLVHVGRILFKL